MTKKITPHPYSDKQAFDRLMLLLATFAKYPGIGALEENERKEEERDALQPVQEKIRELAREIEQTEIDMKINFPEDYPAIATIRKDLETLRKYKLLDRRMYRWGYYLGTGALSFDDLKAVLWALDSVAKNQGNPQARRLYHALEKRLKGLNLEQEGKLFYPVRESLNRAIVYTDPIEMMNDGKNQDNLFHNLDLVEEAIIEGQAIEVSRNKDPYQDGKRLGPQEIWPLQLVYHDIAWYLIYERCDNGLLVVGRVNRFAADCRYLAPKRKLHKQKESLKKAHKLLRNGWGLSLGNKLEDQQAELDKKLPLVTVKVRFFEQVTEFILEGDRRHHSQKITRGLKNPATGRAFYVDYQVKLPPRSLKEFMWWVHKHLDQAQVLSPPELVEQHKEATRALAKRYDLL